MRRTSEPEETTMYMRVTCPVCKGKGTTADLDSLELEIETCDACGGAGFTAPQAVQAWEYSEVRRGWFDHWPIVYDPRRRRSLLRSVLVLVLGVLCGMLGALAADLLMGVW